MRTQGKIIRHEEYADRRNERRDFTVRIAGFYIAGALGHKERQTCCFPGDIFGVERVCGGIRGSIETISD
jgi:hypothetical protein